MRHTFGSHLAMKGADPFQIQELMGHELLATTIRYIHPAAEFKRKAIEVLERPTPFVDPAPELASPPARL
jgi:site-specific recombinase XerD